MRNIKNRSIKEAHDYVKDYVADSRKALSNLVVTIYAEDDGTILDRFSTNIDEIFDDMKDFDTDSYYDGCKATVDFPVWGSRVDWEEVKSYYGGKDNVDDILYRNAREYYSESKKTNEALSNLDDDLQGVMNPVMAHANKVSNERDKKLDKMFKDVEKPDEKKDTKKVTSPDLKKMHLSESLFEEMGMDDYFDYATARKIVDLLMDTQLLKERDENIAMDVLMGN